MSNQRRWITKTLWLMGALALIYLGLGVIRVSEWRTGPIHYHLWGSHGFETQDVVALIMILIGLGWLIWGGRYYAAAIQDRIRQRPIQAFTVALIFGLLMGGLLGVAVSSFSYEPIKEVVMLMLEPAEQVAHRMGNLA